MKAGRQAHKIILRGSQPVPQAHPVIFFLVAAWTHSGANPFSQEPFKMVQAVARLGKTSHQREDEKTKDILHHVQPLFTKTSFNRQILESV